MGPTLEQYLDSITRSDLRAGIRCIREADLLKIQDRELTDLIYSVLKEKKGGSFVLPVSIGTYNKDTVFLRARKAENSRIPNAVARQAEDAWNPPLHLCKRSRLGRPRESLLYTTPENIDVVLQEIGAAPSDKVAVYKFISKANIKTAIIPGNFDELNLAEDAREKLSIIQDFLYDEFTRYVGIGHENLYRISEIIAKNFYDLPSDVVQDAWAYPSVKARDKWNVCFRPENAQGKLTLIGAMLGNIDEGGEFVIKMVAIPDDNGKFVYASIGSQVCSKFFPEIQTS